MTLALPLAACTSGEDATIDEPAADGFGAIARCSVGGSLQETEVINNNIVIAHGEIVDIAVSSNRQVAVASSDGAIKLWTIGDGSGTTLGGSRYDGAFGIGNPIASALAYRADGIAVAGGTKLGGVTLWDATNGQDLGGLSVGEDAITAVAVGGQDEVVAISDASYAGNITLWSTANDTLVGPLSTKLWEVDSLLLVPSSAALVTAGHEYSVPMLEVRDAGDSSSVVAEWKAPLEMTGSVVDLALTADEEYLVAVGGSQGGPDPDSLPSSSWLL